MIDEEKKAKFKKMLEVPNPNYQRFCLRRWLFHVTRNGDHASSVTGESLVAVCQQLKRLEKEIQT